VIVSNGRISVANTSQRATTRFVAGLQRSVLVLIAMARTPLSNSIIKSAHEPFLVRKINFRSAYALIAAAKTAVLLPADPSQSFLEFGAMSSALLTARGSTLGHEIQ